VESELRGFSRRLCGRDDARTVRLVTYALLEAPLAAVRRHVAANERPPPHVDDLIRVTFGAVIGLLVSRNVGKRRRAARAAATRAAVGPHEPASRVDQWPKGDAAPLSTRVAVGADRCAPRKEGSSA
jgi:hypothetical protein